MQGFSLGYVLLYLRLAIDERYIEGGSRATWNESVGMTQMRNRSSATFGRTRLSGRWR
jgi:hypothetical protein